MRELLGCVVLLAWVTRVVRGEDPYLTEPRKCQVNCKPSALCLINAQVQTLNIQILILKVNFSWLRSEVHLLKVDFTVNSIQKFPMTIEIKYWPSRHAM